MYIRSLLPLDLSIILGPYTVNVQATVAQLGYAMYSGDLTAFFIGFGLKRFDSVII